MASGRLKLCEQGQAVGAVCSAVDDPGDLRNGATHLRFDPEELAEVSDASTIYVHVSRSGNDRPNSIYLDYWWYFPHNPTGAGGGSLCGAGFVIAGVTCFDHQSDWEGVTVVLDADSPSGAPVAVAYAQHSGVTRYTWPALERLWDDGDRVNFGRGVDTRVRPLVFVARGTHASYPTSCEDERCQVGDLPGSPAEHPTRENSHDGDERWPRDERADCPSVCVAALPLRGRGQELGLWNAFDGGWGTSDCVLEFDLHLVRAPALAGVPGPLPAPMVRERGRGLAPRRVQPLTPALHRKGTVGERDHGQRAPARPGRLVLLGAGRRLIRPRHQRRREHLLPLAPGLAAATGQAARPGCPPVARVQRRRQPRRAERPARRRGGAPVRADRTNRGRPRSRDDHDRRERRGLRGGA